MHRLAMLDGDRSTVVSNNAQQVDELPGMIAGTDVETALVSLSEAIESYRHAKERLVEKTRARCRHAKVKHRRAVMPID